MSYLTADQLVFPVKRYKILGYKFGQRARRKLILWATHLGDDVGEEGSKVVAIGNGEVVWSEVRYGNEKKHNWGGLIVLGHRGKEKNFYSVYGHLRDLKVRVGDQVVMGQPLGLVAEGRTPENGWWKIPHLHFAIYVGPWQDRVLPGFEQWWNRQTKKKWWKNPKGFIKAYNRV
ncbi:MAG: M23 family metallopeptidase [bacterium]